MQLTVSKRTVRRHLSALMCFIGALSLYVSTLAPTVQGFDSAELTTGAYALGFVHAPGYPVYMLIGYVFTKIPFGDVGWRMNFMSAFFGSVAVFILFHLIIAHKNYLIVSLVSTALFATTPIFWSQAIRAEVYTLETLLMLGVLFVWWQAHRSDQKTLYILCFILLGVAMAHHLTTALLWFSILICSLWQDVRWRMSGLIASVIAIVVMLICYLYFPWRSTTLLQIDYIRPYFSVDTSRLSIDWWLLSAQPFSCYFYIDWTPLALLQELVHLILLMWNNLLGFGVVLAIWGWHGVKRKYPLWNSLLSLYFLMNSIAFLAYHAVDKEVMFIPMYAVACIWAASGASMLVDWARERLHILNADHLEIIVPGILLLAVGGGMWFNWSSVNLHSDRRVYDFAIQLLDEVRPSTIIVNHWVTAAALDYARVIDGRRPDVSSFNLEFYFLGLQRRCDQSNNAIARNTWFTWIRDHMGRRPLCFIEPLPPIPDNVYWVKQRTCWTLASAEEVS